MRIANGLIVFFLMLICFSAGSAFAGITIDGKMGSDWDSQFVVTDFNSSDYVGPGYGGQDYDIEQIGIYVDDTYLYIGLQTGFELNYGEFYDESKDDATDYQNPTPDVLPGDIAIGFGTIASIDYQLALKFDFGTGDGGFQGENTFDEGYDDLSKADLKIYNVTSWKRVQYDGSVAESPFTVNTGVDKGAVEADAKGEVAYNRYDSSGNAYGNGTTNSDPYFNTLEAKIRLDKLSAALGSDLDMANGFTANVFWTMQCNNDMLGASYTYPGDVSSVPEPATFLLYGLGLIGIGAFGRKKMK